MRKLFPVFLLLFVSASSAEIRAACSGCSIGKEKLQCDYYVAQRGDKSRQKECRIYAEYVDIDGAYPKAAWYYLLAGDPEKALEAVRKGLEQGREYGREFLAIALWISGKREEARRELATFRRKVPDHAYLKRDLETIGRLYPKAELEALR
jgi:hypothetical protein